VLSHRCLPILLLCSCSSGGGGAALAITSSAPTLATIRMPYAYALTSAHGAGPVTYQLLAAPAGMSVDAAGMVTWNPQYADLGTHPVSIEASDGTHTATQDFDLRVNQGMLLGTALSWRGHTSGGSPQDVIDHLAGHSPWGSIVAFHANWRDPGDSGGEIPNLATFAMTTAALHGFVPAVGIGWADGSGAPDLTSDSEPANDSWTNLETRDEFRQMLVDFAMANKPPYLFLGNETNTYALTHSAAEWSAWLSEYGECYDAIKAVSPTTLVFTVFQLEHLLGLGANNGWSDPARWDLVDDQVALGKLDALGFTSYPYFEYPTPAAIPAGYYGEIALHWTGPVIFTEIGWLASASVPYPGSESDQAAYVARFFELTQDLDLEYACWLFLHDWDGQAALPAFHDIGFRSNDGSVIRTSDAAWRAEASLRE